MSSIDHNLRDQRSRRLLFDIRTAADTLHGVVTGASEIEQPWPEGVYTCIAALHRAIGIAQAELAELSNEPYVRFLWGTAAAQSSSWGQRYSDLAAQNASAPEQHAGTGDHRPRWRISWSPLLHRNTSSAGRDRWTTTPTAPSPRLVGAGAQRDD